MKNINRKINRLLILVIVAALELGAVTYMVWHWEDVLQNGRKVFWAVEAVDPYDAFKGRYIDLSFKNPAGTIEPGKQYAYNQTVYAVVETDSDNNAHIAEVFDTPPPDKLFVKTKVRNHITGESGKIVGVRLTLPFKRYYLPENLAPAAEKAYRSNVRENKNSVATVRIKGGYAVIEELYIGDKTLREHLERN